ncbi:MAG: hypothetical protein PHS93_08880 [Candidatus Omnitrophica bacterium]|nr:hypothetical protein [Candidatus Omnitrophota bacterium]
MNCKLHNCAVCGKEKYNGAVCIVKGYRGMRWICFECQKKLTEQIGGGEK